ncbi:hypothetical protein MPSEU_000203100 [Mayamaea pseudoterrestris]|nr:hypothetical protein MPSEU_000203100 [Mayamaea pseudoterrestris]
MNDMTQQLSVRKRPPKQEFAPSKQKTILMQYAAQERQHNASNKTFSGNRDYYFRIYLMTVITVVLVGACGVFYSYPEVFVGPANDVESPRHLVTIFPHSVKDMLPYFVDKYALASSENIQARELLQQLTQKRRQLDPNSFRLFAWESKDFEEKLNTVERMDAACGVNGYGDAYHKQAHLRIDLMQWCLLLGRPDGFINWSVKPDPAASWPRTNKGIVGIYLQDENDQDGSEPSRRLSPSIVMLPLDDAEFAGFRVSRSRSNLPTKVLDWIIHHGTLHSPSDYQNQLGSFLYEQVEQNREQWIIWTVACTATQRRVLEERSNVRMATTCSDPVDDNACCSFYAPPSS